MGEQVHYQQISGCKSISKESVALDNFKKFKSSMTTMAQFHYHLSDESDQNAITTATHIGIIPRSIFSKEFIASLLKTMCDHIDFCEKNYHCGYDIYILYCGHAVRPGTGRRPRTNTR